MKKKLFLLLCLPLVAWIGCGGDDDGGDNGTGPSGPPRVVTFLSTSAPSMQTVDDELWDSTTAVTVEIASTLFGAPSTGRDIRKAAEAVAPSIAVQAIYHQGMGDLYLRLTWADATHNVWPLRWEVTSIDQGPLFQRALAEDEDRLLALFADQGDTAWDAWYWRALSTGTVYLGGNTVSGLAEGAQLISDAIVVDTAASSGLVIVHDNPPKGGFPIPSYLHEDTSEFNGFMLYLDADIPTPEPVPEGWTVGQFVPGRRIDSTITSPTKAAGRGSQWDIWSVSDWTQGGPWSVVLKRQLNTTYGDDLNMDVLDSVRVRLGITNNRDFSFTVGSSNQGFTDEFWLIL
jgi:hypothetical protein